MNDSRDVISEVRWMAVLLFLWLAMTTVAATAAIMTRLDRIEATCTEVKR